MTSETTASTMKQHETTELIPKLRFPEFWETSGWEIKLIGPYLEDCSGRVPPETHLPVFSSTREGLKRQDAYFDGRVLQNKSEYGIVPPGCFVYRHMSDDGLFKFNINDTGGAIAVSKEYPVFRTKGLNSTFLLAKLNEGLDFKHFALSQKAGGTRTRLYFSRLCEWHTLLPSLVEQQKIADCLSSLHELIAAQAQKVVVLKTHKKGLMQQLFPREDETQPRLRFPEFQNAGEWEIRFLSQLAKVTTGAKDTQNKVDGGRYPFFVRSQTVERIDSFAYEGEAVLTSGDGVGVGKNFHYIKGRFDYHQRVYCIYDFHQDVSGLFFYLYFSEHFGDRVMRMSAKNSVDSVRMAMITEMAITMPPLPEQQKVADCLTRLDDLITAQSQKLTALKTHKKALMQQLFPSPEEVEV
jgi:type I restriction enzyme S subunit